MRTSTYKFSSAEERKAFVDGFYLGRDSAIEITHVDHLELTIADADHPYVGNYSDLMGLYGEADPTFLDYTMTARSNSGLIVINTDGDRVDFKDCSSEALMRCSGLVLVARTGETKTVMFPVEDWNVSHRDFVF